MTTLKRGGRGRALVLTAILAATATACATPSSDADLLSPDGREVVAESPSPDRPDPTPAVQEPTAVPEPTPEAAPAAVPVLAADRETSSAPSRSERQETAPEPAGSSNASAASAAGESKSAPAGRPTAATTGVPAGTSLTSTGGGTLNDNGAVYKNVVFTGDVLASGDNQTFVNVRFEGLVRVTGSGTTITDSELGSLVVSGAKNFHASRLDVFGYPGKDGLHVTSDVGRAQNIVIERSRIHSPNVKSESHYDGIQVRGVDGLTLRGNSFELGAFKPQYNASIFLQNANGGNTNVSIDGNYLNGGGYAVYLGGSGTTFTNNVFGPSANWGLLYPDSNMGSVTTHGNTGPDGAPVNF